MDITRRRLLILLPAAAVAWKFIQAGTPEGAPNYKTSEHWWGMLIDIGKCIGCGNCVRACSKENNVPEGYYRTWIERYHGSKSDEQPEGGFAQRRHGQGFPLSGPQSEKSFFVPKLCNHCVDSPCVQVCPVGATFVSPDGVVLVDKNYCLGCRYCVQACPYGCRFINPQNQHVPTSAHSVITASPRD